MAIAMGTVSLLTAATFTLLTMIFSESAAAEEAAECQQGMQGRPGPGRPAFRILNVDTLGHCA
jgi:hypothetical protein